MMSRYFLSTHSYACEAGGHAVFLDLKRDKYIAVAPKDVATLRDAVQGWPATHTADSARAGEIIAACSDDPVDIKATTCDFEDSTDGGDLIDMLMTEGLLTADASMGKEATPPYLETPTSTFLAAPRTWPHLTVQHMKNFVSAWALTALMLRTLPIGWIVRRAQRRKEREAHKAPPFTVVRARQLTTIHLALQPVFYPAKDACLRNSITLIEFLAKYQIYPTWAFGVKMQPWAAHSWVQQGPIVLTDPIDHVKSFTPIMLI